MPRWNRIAIACCGALTATVAAACGDSGTGDSGNGGRDEQTSGEEDRLVEMLNESRRIEAEAVAVENRVIERCLDDRGHTVHDPRELRSWKAGEYTGIVGGHPHEHTLPGAELAAEWGFGQWVYVDGADPDAAEQWEQLSWTPYSSEDQWEDVDDSAFEALSPDEQFSWHVDHLGRAHAQWLYGDHFGIEAPEENTEGGGELVVEQNISDEPPPGGCRLEMIEALYGEPQRVELEGGSADDAETLVMWGYRPAVPLGNASALFTVESAVTRVEEDLVIDFRDRIAAEEEDFLDCLAEHGHGNWTFEERGGLNIYSYWGQIYHGDEYLGADGGPVPDPPADLPSEFESLKTLEIAMAVDAAQCADETGLRAAAETAWDQVNRDYYVSVETQLYAWQEEMRDAIERGQELLGA